MAELSAVGIYVQYWWPELPTWVSALAFFLVINAINLTNVKFFGEMEFWFATYQSGCDYRHDFVRWLVAAERSWW